MKPYTIIEVINVFNLKAEQKKNLYVHFDRSKKSRHKTFTPEPQAKRKTTAKEQKIFWTFQAIMI